MRFFTKDLFHFNDYDPDVQNKVIDDYLKHREQLRPLLTKNAERFFFRTSLHDGKLLSFTTGDAPRSRSRTCFNFVEITVLDEDEVFLHHLRFSKVSKCVLDFPSDRPFEHYGDGFEYDSWLYDELSMVRDGVFRFEVLFASGATLLMEYRHFSYRRSKYSSSRNQ